MMSAVPRHGLQIRLYVSLYEKVFQGAKSSGQPIRLKLGTKVGCDKIFQKSLWLTSLTVCSGVSGAVPPKIHPFIWHFESAMKLHW